MKFRVDSEGYWQYGPYALVDRATKELVALRLDAEAVEGVLLSDGQRPKQPGTRTREKQCEKTSAAQHQC